VAVRTPGGWTSARTARGCGVMRPRTSDLLRGRVLGLIDEATAEEMRENVSGNGAEATSIG
jgi:hypothetical protein